MKREPLPRKQSVIIIVTLFAAFMPITMIVVLLGQRWTTRQLTTAGMINLAIVVPLIIFIARRWISKIT